MLVLSLSIYVEIYYLLLLIILAVYLDKKYIKKQIFLYLLFLCFLSVGLLRFSSFQPQISGEVKAILYNGIQVEDYLIKIDTTNYQLGDIIRAEVILNDFPHSNNDGQFDEATYLKSKGIVYVVYPTEITIIDHHFHLRNKVINFVEKRSDERLKGIYHYLLLGNKTEQITDLSAMASELAIVHVFAISGMHFTLLSEWTSKLLSYWMSEKKAKWISLIFMTIYAICLEGNVAAWRAFLTMVFKQLGIKDDYACFGVVGTLLLLLNPRVMLQTGFIYSMLLYFLVVHTKNMKWSNIFVYLGSMAISSFFQYELMPLGFLFGLVFNLIITAVFPIFLLDLFIGGFLSQLCFYLYQGMLYLMKWACQYSFKLIIGQPPLYLVIAFFMSYIFALEKDAIYKKRHYYIYPLLSVFLMVINPYLNPYGSVTMIDVGQGDCYLISLAYNQENILIDTGGLSYKDVAADIVIPYLKYKGIKKLDTIYISHQDFDHCGALESLKAQFKVEQVIEDFDKNMHQNHVFKQLNTKNYDNENDNSLVIETTLGGLVYLFTGDISIQVEKDLLRSYPQLDVDVLKVGHHGSNTSSCNEWIRKITPKISLISVGKNNQYGHPNKKVINRLKAYGSYIIRSDEAGTFSIYFKDEYSFIEKTK